MIWNDVELHNVAEIRETEDGGVLLQRVPEAVRMKLNAHAQERMLETAGTEIRFVMETDRINLQLRAPHGKPCAQVYFGDFLTGQTFEIRPELQSFEIKRPDWFLSLDRRKFGRMSFPPMSAVFI